MRVCFLTVRGVHLEMVTDLTSSAFIACLRRFVTSRGDPSLLWSNHDSNFIGAHREMKEMLTFLKERTTQEAISKFCSAKQIRVESHTTAITTFWRDLGSGSEEF